MSRHRVALILLAAGIPIAAASMRAQCAPPIQRLISDRKFDAARAQLDAQIKRAPRDDVSMHCMGRLLLEQNESGDAVSWLEKAVQVNGKSAQHHLWLGLALRTEGQKAGMLRAPALIGRMKTELEQALALDPTLVDARYGLLQYYAGAPAMMGGSMTKARELAAEISKLNPMRGHIGNGFIADQEKDFAGAEKEYLAAISAKPDSDVAYGAAGGFYRRRERWNDAIGMYEEQLKTMAKDAYPSKISNTHFFLGEAEEKTGHRDKAKTEYQIAIGANPKNDDAVKALASLKNN